MEVVVGALITGAFAVVVALISLVRRENTEQHGQAQKARVASEARVVDAIAASQFAVIEKVDKVGEKVVELDDRVTVLEAK